MRNKLITAGVVALLLLLGFGGWTLFSGNRAAAPEDRQQTTGEQATTQETTLPPTEDSTAPITITYRDAGFERSRYEIKVGGKLMVVNDSSRTLEFASDDHPTHLENPELNLKPLKPGETASITVSKAGTWGIHDHLKADLTTTLDVSN